MESDEKVCPFCSETIKSAAIVCKYCGKNLSDSVVPPSPVSSQAITIAMQQSQPVKNQKKKTGCLKIGLYILLGSMVIGMIGAVVEKARRVADPDYARRQDEELEKKKIEQARIDAERQIEREKRDAEIMAEKARRDKEAQEKAARLDAATPRQQKDFISAIINARNEFNEQENEIQRERVRDARRNAIRGILNGYAIDNWFGTIEEISTNSDGLGILVITVNERPGIEIGTWNNAFSDVADNTLIEKTSPVYNAMADLKSGDKVWFSGKFAPSDRDLIEEASLTISGSMNGPRFILQFSSLKKFE